VQEYPVCDDKRILTPHAKTGGRTYLGYRAR